MTAQSRNLWPLLLALGVVFTFLNLFELAFADGGWPQVVGVPIGIAVVAVGIARRHGWEGVRR